MKKLFYFLGVAVLATGLMLSCSKDDDNSSSSSNNGGGNGGNGGNGGGNSNTPSMVFTWGGSNAEINVMSVQIYKADDGLYEMLFKGVKNQYQDDNNQTLINVPAFTLGIYNFGASQTWEFDDNVRVCSEDLMNEDRVNMFATYDETNHVWNIERGDYEYVNGTLSVSGVNVDEANHTVSATITANFKSVFDGTTVKTLKVVANKYTYTDWN